MMDGTTAWFSLSELADCLAEKPAFLLPAIGELDPILPRRADGGVGIGTQRGDLGDGAIVVQVIDV
jgi:hypothetical protein